MGIASGKSTIIETIRKETSLPVLDADKLGHSCYEPGTECFNDIVAEFGDHIVNPKGEIDRRKLGPIVFSDSAKLEALCKITWPRIRSKIAGQIEKIKSNPNGAPDAIFVEAAVLFEAEWMDLFDEIWVVIVPEDIALARLIKRNSLSESDARKRIRAQLSNEERCTHATRVLKNEAADGGHQLRTEVLSIITSM